MTLLASNYHYWQFKKFRLSFALTMQNSDKSYFRERTKRKIKIELCLNYAKDQEILTQSYEGIILTKVIDPTQNNSTQL